VRAREGSIFSRTARALTGAPLSLELPARVSYSRPAVARLVGSVARRVDRRARNVTVSRAGDRLKRVRARQGAKVRTTVLRRRVAGALAHPARTQVVSVPWARVRPKVTTSDLAVQYPNYIGQAPKLRPRRGA